MPSAARLLCITAWLAAATAPAGAETCRQAALRAHGISLEIERLEQLQHNSLQTTSRLQTSLSRLTTRSIRYGCSGANISGRPPECRMISSESLTLRRDLRQEAIARDARSARINALRPDYLEVAQRFSADGDCLRVARAGEPPVCRPEDAGVVAGAGETGRVEGVRLERPRSVLDCVFLCHARDDCTAVDIDAGGCTLGRVDAASDRAGERYLLCD